MLHFLPPLTSSTLKDLVKRKISTAKLKTTFFREKAFLLNTIYLNLHPLFEFLFLTVKKMLLFTLFLIQ